MLRNLRRLLKTNSEPQLFNKKSFLRRAFFLILLDVNMPGIDGLETCRQIKTHPEYEKIEIIFVSAMSSTEDRIKGYEAGGFDYFSKPFHEDELLY